MTTETWAPVSGDSEAWGEISKFEPSLYVESGYTIDQGLYFRSVAPRNTWTGRSAADNTWASV